MNPQRIYNGLRVRCTLDGRVGHVTETDYHSSRKVIVYVKTDVIRAYLPWQLEPYDLPKLAPFHMLPWRFQAPGGGDVAWMLLSEDDRSLYQAYALCNVLHVPGPESARRLTARAKELGLDVEVTYGDHRDPGIRPKNAWGGRPRRSGKVTDMLRQAAEQHATIVCATKDQMSYLSRLAFAHGLYDLNIVVGDGKLHGLGTDFIAYDGPGGVWRSWEKEA